MLPILMGLIVDPLAIVALYCTVAGLTTVCSNYQKPRPTQSLLCILLGAGTCPQEPFDLGHMVRITCTFIYGN